MTSVEEEAVEAKPAEVPPAETLEWDVEMEIQLFYAMANHKPVGINKHFQMACIWEKLSNSITKEITTQDIWKHLDNLYDMNTLDETETFPFPNTEVAFSLPESEFGAMIKEKCKDSVGTNESEGNEATPTLPETRSPSPKTSTPRSSSRGTASKDSTPKIGAARKDSTSASLATKSRKESGSSHASTDTPSIKSEKDYERRRDSRDSNASGPKDSSSSRKSTSQKDRSSKSKLSTTAWEPPVDEEAGGRRGRRRANTSTPPATVPAKRRRT